MVIIEGHADQHEREFAFQVFAGTLEHNIAQDYYDDVVDAFLRANALREALGIRDPLAIFE